MRVSWTSLGTESTKVKCAADQFNSVQFGSTGSATVKPRTEPHYKRFTVQFWFSLIGSVWFGSPVQNWTLTSLEGRVGGKLRRVRSSVPIYVILALRGEWHEIFCLRCKHQEMGQDRAENVLLALVQEAQNHTKCLASVNLNCQSNWDYK